MFSDRELIVTDNPFDDHGADVEEESLLEGISGSLVDSGDPPKALGDYRYPQGYVENSADIVEVRVAADAQSWFVLVALNTLLDPNRSAFEIGIDGHRMEVHGEQGTIDGNPVSVHADAVQNTFEIRVPRSSFDPGDVRRPMFVGAGLWNTGIGAWLDPDPNSTGAPFFDVAYVPDEGMDSPWRDAKQSRHIFQSSFYTDEFSVDFGRLLDNSCTRSTCVEAVPYAGLYTRVFRSGQSLGEGVSVQDRWDQDDQEAGYKLYRSRYQTYVVYEPVSDTAVSRPLVLLLHPAGGNHMTFALNALSAAGGLAHWADELDAIVAMPLARGEGGWYEGEAEKDVFEVWRDLASHYDIDRERVYLMGVGMGGFGALRLAHLYPDQFAGVLTWSAPVTPNSIWAAPASYTTPQANPPACDRDAAGCGYNLTDLFGNARAIPLMAVYGGRDHEVPVGGPETWMAQYAQSGGPHRYVLYPSRGFVADVPNDDGFWVRSWIGGLPPRQTAPTHVTYTIVRDLFQPEFGLSYDRAYWVGDLRLADGAAEGFVDANRAEVVQEGARVEPQAGVDNSSVPYRIEGRDPSPEQASANFLSLRMRGLSEAGLDTVDMGWDISTLVRITGETDGPVDLVLSGAFPDQMGVEGATFSRRGTDVILHLPAGPFMATLEPA